MYSFVAKQPIFDKENKTVAYELFFRNGLTNSFPQGISAEKATTSLIIEQFIDNSISNLVGNCQCYINFPYSLIVDKLVDFLPVNKVVIEIVEDSEPDDALFNALKLLKKKKFKIALDNFIPSKEWIRFLPYIDIIKINFRGAPFEDVKNFMFRYKLYDISFLAGKIENHDEYILAKKLGFSLFQGFFFSKPQLVVGKKISQNQLIVMQLLREVTKPDLNYGQIEKLFKCDMSLAYKFLRYVNTVRSVDTSSINSLRHAMVYMGASELKRFVTLVSATSLGEDTPYELYHMSLARAIFCESLSKMRNGTTDPQEAFLCGMLSLYDSIMGQPMTEILETIPISDDIKQALTNEKGELAFYLKLARDYESLKFSTVRQRAKCMGILEEQIIKLYTDAHKTATAILHGESYLEHFSDM